MQRKLKALADFMPVVGFFGVFFFFGRDLYIATSGLVVGLCLQLLIYWFIQQHIPTWMKAMTAIAFVFATLTLVINDPTFIKIRSTVTGFLIGLILVGSVLIRKNVLQLILGKLMIFPTKTWNNITILWSLPIFANATLNLVIANQIPWLNMAFSDDVWMTYRFVSGFFVTGLSIGLVVLYLVITKQRPHFNMPEEPGESASEPSNRENQLSDEASNRSS